MASNCPTAVNLSPSTVGSPASLRNDVDIHGRPPIPINNNQHQQPIIPVAANVLNYDNTVPQILRLKRKLPPRCPPPPAVSGDETTLNDDSVSSSLVFSEPPEYICAYKKSRPSDNNVGGETASPQQPSLTFKRITTTTSAAASLLLQSSYATGNLSNRKRKIVDEKSSCAAEESNGEKTATAATSKSDGCDPNQSDDEKASESSSSVVKKNETGAGVEKNLPATNDSGGNSVPPVSSAQDWHNIGDHQQEKQTQRMRSTIMQMLQIYGTQGLPSRTPNNSSADVCSVDGTVVIEPNVGAADGVLSAEGPDADSQCQFRIADVQHIGKEKGDIVIDNHRQISLSELEDQQQQRRRPDDYAQNHQEEQQGIDEIYYDYYLPVMMKKAKEDEKAPQKDAESIVDGGDVGEGMSKSCHHQPPAAVVGLGEMIPMSDLHWTWLQECEGDEDFVDSFPANQENYLVYDDVPADGDEDKSPDVGDVSSFAGWRVYRDGAAGDDDSDDSNAEDNYRNDYPDEDGGGGGDGDEHGIDRNDEGAEYYAGSDDDDEELADCDLGFRQCGLYPKNKQLATGKKRRTSFDYDEDDNSESFSDND